jgi:hypothetical protein
VSASIDSISLSTENPSEKRLSQLPRRSSRDRVDQSVIDVVQSSQIKYASWATYHPKATPVLTDCNNMTTSSSFCPVNPSYWFFQSIQFIHFLDDSENKRPLTLEKNQFQSCHSRPHYKGWISTASRYPVAISWYSSIGISPPVPRFQVWVEIARWKKEGANNVDVATSKHSRRGETAPKRVSEHVMSHSYPRRRNSDPGHTKTAEDEEASHCFDVGTVATCVLFWETRLSISCARCPSSDSVRPP